MDSTAPKKETGSVEDPAAASARKVSVGEGVTYGAGAISDVFLNNAYSYLAFPIYQLGLGLNPAWISFVLMFSRLVDAGSDSIAGYVTDNLRSRFGRRRPLIFAGALASAVAFVLVWTPPRQWSHGALNIYLLVGAALFYICYSLFTVPWGALGLEISDDPRGRTVIQTYKAVFQGIGGVLLGGMWWLSLRLGPDKATGLERTALLFAVVIALAGIVPAFFCREKVPAERPHMPFLKGLGLTLSCRPFLRLAAVTLLVIVGVFTINALALYINLSHVFKGDEQAVAAINFWSNLVFQISSIASAPLAPWMAARLGKARALMATLGLVATGFASTWFCYTPQFPYLQIVSLALIAPGLGFLWILGPSMLADICDIDARQTGIHRAGVFSATYAWMIKLSLAASLGLSGAIIVWCGYVKTAPVQTFEVETRMRLAYALVPMLLIGIATFLAKGLGAIQDQCEAARASRQS